MTARTLVCFAVAAGLALPAGAFSPGPPRPIPPNVTGVCSDGQPPPNDPTGTCGVAGNACNQGAVCLVDPAAEDVLATARGVLTLIVDEDVAGFLATTDTSPGRLDNARFTVLLELTRDGAPLAVAETFQLDRVGIPALVECDILETESSLCVPSWRQPITEKNLIAEPDDGDPQTVDDVVDLGLQWAAVNANLQTALRSVLLSPADLVAHPDALVLLEVVDGVIEGFGPFTADQIGRLDQFDQSGGGLASVRRFKVTIQVIVP
jgi:hypothetical protein